MYNFHLDGSFEDFSWQEEIVRGNGKGSDYVFSQRGGGGIIIGKDENGNPRLPWGVGGGE